MNSSKMLKAIVFRDTNNQILIRNIIIPQFHKFLKNNSTKNVIDMNLTSMPRFTKLFCYNNRIIFTRVDKGNVTVALDKDFYTDRIELVTLTRTLLLIKIPLNLLREILTTSLKLI